MSNDDLKRLADALQAPPAADPATRAAHLRAALDNFDTHQEQARQIRQTPERPKAGAQISKGLSDMFEKLTSRAGLALSTGLVSAGLAVIVVLPLNKTPQQPLPNTAETTGASASLDQRTADVAAPMVDEIPSAPPIQAEEIAVQVPKMTVSPNTISSSTAPTATRTRAAEPQAAALPERAFVPAPMGTEAFPETAPNPLRITTDAPVSTFSIDVDTASYALVRQSLMSGSLPPRDAVRIEEMVNYFPYDYPAPDAGGAPFRPTISTMATPWNAETQLVHIALQGQLPTLEERPPLNLVLLIDTSGSMTDANKLPLLKQSLRLMLPMLRPTDQIAIVTYAGSAGQVLAPTPAREQATILAALERLDAGGTTAGQAGLQQAYGIAAGMGRDGDVTRVLLATDGDFNVGLSDPQALEDYIATKRESGTYLSVLGFGRGNLDDATMQALAQNGNGTAAYIDTLSEARKVLVDQLSGALFPIANDVKIQVEFNPATVAEYRLLGYETRALRREDFNNDRVDAGEIGAGHSVTALYEITPAGSPAVLSDPLRYGASAPASRNHADELGFLRLRYKAPGATDSTLIEAPIPAKGTMAGDEARFGAAIAGFGQLLRAEHEHLGGWSYAQAADLAQSARGTDPFGYRAEAITLMRLAAGLSAKPGQQ